MKYLPWSALPTTIYACFSFVSPKPWSYPQLLGMEKEMLIYHGMACLAVFVALVSLIEFCAGKHRLACFFGFLLSLPMLGSVFVVPEVPFGKLAAYQEINGPFARWGRMIRPLNDLLLKYYKLHPERFHRHGGDERADVEGFSDFVKDSLPELPSSKFGDVNLPTLRLKFTETSVLDPWGEPFVLGCDFNHDGVLDLLGEQTHFSGSSYGPEEIERQYCASGVGMGLAHIHGSESGHDVAVKCEGLDVRLKGQPSASKN